MGSKRIYLLLIVCVIVIFAGCVVTVVLSDNEPPVITIHEEELVECYTDEMDVKELLAGVTAYDEKDGDVTDKISIVNMVVLGDGNQVKVTYAAQDKSNNISKQSILVNYSGTRQFIDVETETDGDKKEKEETTESETEEENTTEPQPKNQEGGSGEPVKINQDVVNQTGVPQIELKYTDYTIHLGESFSTVEALDMVQTTYDEKEAVSNRIVINGLKNVDTNTLGDYVLNYSVSDTEGNRSEVQVLTLHVIE